MNRLAATLVLSLALCATAFAQDKKDEPLEPAHWPTTVQATVADLLARLSERDKDAVRKTKKEDLILYHFGWGMGIRNHYGLWRGNRALLEDACGKGCHPDNASGVIIEAVWHALQDAPP